ncbi:O-antigen ligase family protein [Massilia sp. S19_KUP03_FR1]|uniref:O-antigen ligase family protein n=1 Tax=Massilia sp. S19_KUP03_FR1 TaxID=3025503 RepID=UPI002FCDA457
MSHHSGFRLRRKGAFRTHTAAGGRFLRWYKNCVLGIAMGAIYTNLAIYCYVLNPAMLPKFIFFGLFLIFSPLLITNKRDLVPYLLSPFFLWAMLLLILNVIHLAAFSTTSTVSGLDLIDQQGEARRSLVVTRSQYILFAIIFGFVPYATTGRKYLYPIVLLMILVPCAVILDFTHPGLLYPTETEGAVLGRAAAMFINPTMAGEAVLHIFLLGCMLTRMHYRLPFFILAGAAVLSTFSRSSIIAWVLIFFILVWKRTLPRSAVIVTAIIVGIFLVFLGSFESYIQSRQDFESAFSNILSRLDFFSSFKLNDDSSEERADVIRAAWELFLQNPFFGAGAGATQFWSYRASTHNQILLLAAEYGLFGIGLWIWMIVILWKGNFFTDRGLQLAMVFLFAFMSLFTHQMFDSASYWLATFALLSTRENIAGRAGS